MSFERAKIRQLRPNVWLIDDAGESTCYLICGSERALLVDTLNGEEDLMEIVRTLTQLPVTVVNTHGHCDHVYGNVFFGEAWLHPADEALMKAHFAMFQEDLDRRNLHPCPTRPLTIGQTFDLGGVVLEVVDLSGHTAGSVGLLDRAARVLYSGDGVNPHLWMQLEESLPIARLQEMLTKLKQQHGGAFDRVLTGHAKGYTGAEIVDVLFKACGEMLAGQTVQDPDYAYFGGTCRQHPTTGVPGECIVYAEDKL